MRTLALLVLCAATCLAQLDDNTISVTASRTVVFQPDQALVRVILGTSTDSALDEILAILDGTGFTAADLVSANTSAYYDGELTSWQFSKAIPFSSLKTLLPRLAAIQQSHRQNGSTAAVFYYDVSGQTSQLAAQACPFPTLISDARTQAQQIAAAAGARIGTVVSMSQGGAASVPNPWFDAPTFATPASQGAATSMIWSQSSASPGCSMTVQFQLLR